MVDALEKIVAMLARAFHYTLRNPRRMGGLALFVLVWLCLAFFAHVIFNFLRGPGGPGAAAEGPLEVLVFLVLTFLVQITVWAYRGAIWRGVCRVCGWISGALASLWQRLRHLGALLLATALAGALWPEPARADAFQLEPGLNIDTSQVEVGAVLVLPPAHVEWEDSYRYVCLSLMLLADEDDGREPPLQVIALSDPELDRPESPETYCTDLRRYYDRRATQRLVSSIVDGKVFGPAILTFDRRQDVVRYFRFELSKVPRENKPIWDALGRWSDLAVSEDWPDSGAIIDPCTRPRSIRRAVTDTARTWMLSIVHLVGGPEEDGPAPELCG